MCVQQLALVDEIVACTIMFLVTHTHTHTHTHKLTPASASECRQLIKSEKKSTLMRCANLTEEEEEEEVRRCG